MSCNVSTILASPLSSLWGSVSLPSFPSEVESFFVSNRPVVSDLCRFGSCGPSAWSRSLFFCKCLTGSSCGDAFAFAFALDGRTRFGFGTAPPRADGSASVLRTLGLRLCLGAGTGTVRGFMLLEAKSPNGCTCFGVDWPGNSWDCILGGEIIRRYFDYTR